MHRPLAIALALGLQATAAITAETTNTGPCRGSADQAAASTGQGPKGDQAPAPTGEAPKGPDVGTKHDGAGTTGWTGGDGGSTVGIDKSGKADDKPGHSETATGLDPIEPGKPNC